MIEKVTVQLNQEGRFAPEAGTCCEEMNPKELLLYAAAQCAGQTAIHIMQKERIAPKRFEIGFSGDLSTEKLQSDSTFRSFHVVYNVECGTEEDQARVSRAVELTHDTYCGMLQMLRRIAPVSREIAVVSTDAVEA
ncbi:OsmC family protein [Alistipes sp.]|uniref:OsmC family protein n=1 Tax=Alistipes sp. TaxID=1872444 RepID=UPI003AEF8F3F